MFLGIALASAALLASVACSTMEKSAAKDPQRCERDPTCTSKQDKSKDCATVCADNIDCMDRCQQIQGRR